MTICQCVSPHKTLAELFHKPVSHPLVRNPCNTYIDNCLIPRPPPPPYPAFRRAIPMALDVRSPGTHVTSVRKAHHHDLLPLAKCIVFQTPAEPQACHFHYHDLTFVTLHSTNWASLLVVIITGKPGISVWS